jgi:hypothetical protein
MLIVDKDQLLLNFGLQREKAGNLPGHLERVRPLDWLLYPNVLDMLNFSGQTPTGRRDFVNIDYLSYKHALILFLSFSVFNDLDHLS